MAKNVLQSPDEIGDHLRVTAVPTYLLAAAIIILSARATLTPHPHLMPGMSAIVTLGSTNTLQYN